MTVDEIRKVFRERGIKKVKIGGFDVDAVLRGKYVSVEKFLSVTDKGLGFCDVIFGWDIGDVLYDNVKTSADLGAYPDVLAKVDLTTMRVTPWEPDTATFLLDFSVFPGNSGGPVFISRQQNPTGLTPVSDKAPDPGFIAGLLTQQVELNSERLEIGIVTHAKYIRETIDLLTGSLAPSTVAEVPVIEPAVQGARTAAADEVGR